MPNGRLDEISSLLTIFPATAAEYDEKKELMRQFVDRQIRSRKDIGILLGGNPYKTLEDNHLQHVLFVSMVLRLNAFQILAGIIPWVYRSYHKRGISYDYFPLAMQTWLEAASRLLTPQACEQISPIYRWILNHHRRFVMLAENNPAIPFDVQFAGNILIQQCLDKLLAGDYPSVCGLTEQYLLPENSLCSLYVDVFQPCLYEIGRRWETGAMSVAHEHLSVAIVSRAMFHAFQRFDLPRETRGTALITAAPNEYHEIGAHMVSDLLMLDGWEVKYLGAATPMHDLIAFAKEERPLFLGISAVLPSNVVYIAQAIEAMKTYTELKELKIMVGGLAFSLDDTLWQAIGADAYATNAGDALTIAREWSGHK